MSGGVKIATSPLLQLGHALSRVERMTGYGSYVKLELSFNWATRSRAWKADKARINNTLFARFNWATRSRAWKEPIMGFSIDARFDSLQLGHALSRVERP